MEQKNFKELLHNVKALAFDVDGVLTDSTLILMPDGELVRTMNMRDSIAMKLAVKSGLHVCIITGGASMAVKQRLNRLGITDIYLKTENKLDAMKEFVSIYELKMEEVLYMGDDLVDHEVMSRVGVPVCPNDAVSEIKDICVYVSDKQGGKGCVRDVIEQVMKIHGTWTIPKF
jgi:3-deoxy-D-manno-octulosonate 8-phosphate phosphatase (KDO 8-P phosphatase)